MFLFSLCWLQDTLLAAGLCGLCPEQEGAALLGLCDTQGHPWPAATQQQHQGVGLPPLPGQGDKSGAGSV